MEDLARIRDSYINDGLSYAQAEARCAQDAMLDLITKSTLVDNITIKGGVLMQHVSKDARRATTDFDLDFVRYPIADTSIKKFIKTLDTGGSAFSVKLTGSIEELKHQDYSGKRIHVIISDDLGNSIERYLLPARRQGRRPRKAWRCPRRPRAQRRFHARAKL
ncbi:hypothetical protein [Adlercreutzia caecimuris]|uniref:Nucleotidyl transferase AbiEii toxin, Type IV TA system n=1 Tax=Adlercreutzia caecimuris B7 TaxID=1235794 RepID=R9L2W6_9ACTN|nr:hypothetical protein [Adlercreutzia caecimuris]EOS50107.1 hypothetical protein C811_01730 [Adlercreutzia caecimuris B7]